jgi:hypothetical protein
VTEWLVRLQGEKLDLEEASIHFRTADLEVRREDDDHYLACTEFSCMTESSEVLKRAVELLKVMNGTLRLTAANHQPVTADGIVVRVDEAGKRDLYVHAAAAATVRAQVHAAAVVVGSDRAMESPAEHATQTATWMAIARRDDEVAYVLGLFARPTLVKLFNVLEAIRGDVGGEKTLEDTGWAAKGEIERFTQTVNIREAAGDEARHGKRGFEAPKKPMSLREAQNLFGAIIKRWLQTKAIDSKASEG